MGIAPIYTCSTGQIAAAAGGVGIETPALGSRADVLIVREGSAENARAINPIAPQIVAAPAPVEPERLIEGSAFVSAATRSIESIFDGAQWSIHESP